VTLFGSSGFWRFVALHLRQVLYEPPPRHSPIATFFSGVLARSRLSLLQLIVLLFVLCFSLVSLYFVSSVSFCFDFPLYFFLLGFPVFALVFPCIAPLYLLCVFFGFYNSTDRLRACFAALRPLPGLFLHPHHIELPMRPLVYGVCLHVINFISQYFYCFFAYNKSCLDWPTFGCDAWSRSLGSGCKHYPGFRVKEDKCWPRVLSPQC
jgi:hypothetical protein